MSDANNYERGDIVWYQGKLTEVTMKLTTYLVAIKSDPDGACTPELRHLEPSWDNIEEITGYKPPLELN